MKDTERFNLVKVLQDYPGISSKPRDLHIEITMSGCRVLIDYCAKHGTGTGKYYRVTDLTGDGLPCLAYLDNALLDIAKGYVKCLEHTAESIKNTLADIDES